MLNRLKVRSFNFCFMRIADVSQVALSRSSDISISTNLHTSFAAEFELREGLGDLVNQVAGVKQIE